MKLNAHVTKVLSLVGMAIIGGFYFSAHIEKSEAQNVGLKLLQVADIDEVQGMSTDNPLANYPAGNPANAGQEVSYDNEGISIFIAPTTLTTPITTDSSVSECGHVGLQEWKGGTYAYKIADANTWQKRRSPCAGTVIIGSSGQIRAQTLTIKGTSVEGKKFTLQVRVPEHTAWDKEVGGGSRRLYVDDTGSTYACYSDSFNRVWPNECEFSPQQALQRTAVGQGFGVIGGNGLCQAGETTATTPQDCPDMNVYSYTLALSSAANQQVEAKPGAKALVKMKLKNTGTSEVQYSVTCNTTPAYPLEYKTFTPTESSLGTGAFNFSFPPNVEKELGVSVDVGAAPVNTTVQLSCLGRRVSGAPPDEKTVTDTVSMVAPVVMPVAVGTTTSSVTEAAKACENGGKCPKNSWCNSGQRCFYPDSQITCVAWPQPPMGGSVMCPAGTAMCNPTDTMCVENRQIVDYVDGKWCQNGQKAYSADGKKMTCLPWGETLAGYTSCRPGDANCISENNYGPVGGTCSGMKCYQKTTDTNPANDAFCQPPMMATPMIATPMEMPACPSGYGRCSPTDTSCKEKGDKWSENLSSAYCMNAQKCALATGGGMCVGMNESCPSGTKYCSSGDEMCMEPDTYRPIAVGEMNRQPWCGGMGMTFYSSTQAYCAPKKSPGAASMWTGSEVKAVLEKLGGGWGVCRPGSTTSNSSCIEPGKTGDANGWCAWWPPNYSGASPMSGSGPRTCPGFDDTPPKPMPVPTPTPVPLPIDQMTECKEDQMPTAAASCRMPMYRWIIADKKWEKCDATKSQTYVSIKDNPKAQYTNCESFNFKLEESWRTKRNLTRPPEIYGDWYMPPWDAATKQMQYSPKSDKFEECSAAGRTAAMPYVSGQMEYYAPCTPLPDTDKEWLLEKFRAEYKMHQLWNRSVVNPDQPLVPTQPILPPQPIEPPLAQCNKDFAKNTRFSLRADQQFWKDIKRQLDQAEGYSESSSVQQLLDSSYKIIVGIDKSLKGKLTLDICKNVQEQLNTLHTDLFSELSSYMPDINEYAQVGQCRAQMQRYKEKVAYILKSARGDAKKAQLQEVLTAIESKQAELAGEHEFDYDALYECRNFTAQLEPKIASVTLANDEELTRIVDTVLSERLSPVLEKLEKQLGDRGEKLDTLLVQVAQLHKSLDEVNAAANSISEKITTSYTALAHIQEKFSEQKQQIQAAKDRIIPLVDRVTVAIKERSCVQGRDQGLLFAAMGDIASVNWLSEEAEQIEKRLNNFLASCEARDVSRDDVALFVKNTGETATENLRESHEQGITPFADVPTHEWYYGGMVTAQKNGYLTQGRPAENVLRQDALLMVLRASGVGDEKLTGACANVGVTISPYAQCAATYASSHGLFLSGDMTKPIQRSELAEWVTKLIPLPKPVDLAATTPYFDLGGLSNDTRRAISQLIVNEIMVGTATGEKMSFGPYQPLTRASLAVVLEKISNLSQ